MKALILASGIGKRLQPLTNKMPKALVKVGNMTLLERIIKSAQRYDIGEFVITTGYHKGVLQNYLKRSFPRLNVEYAWNKFYLTTNYIYSMWVARQYLMDDDILYFHSDLLFDPTLLKRVIDAPFSCALIHQSFTSEKDFNAIIEKGKITKINVKIFEKKARFCLPIYKFKQDDFTIWMERIEKFVREGNKTSYAETALNEVMNKIDFRPVYFGKEIGMEIDDFGDLKKAERLLKRL